MCAWARIHLYILYRLSQIMMQITRSDPEAPCWVRTYCVRIWTEWWIRRGTSLRCCSIPFCPRINNVRIILCRSYKRYLWLHVHVFCDCYNTLEAEKIVHACVWMRVFVISLIPSQRLQHDQPRAAHARHAAAAARDRRRAARRTHVPRWRILLSRVPLRKQRSLDPNREQEKKTC